MDKLRACIAAIDSGFFHHIRFALVVVVVKTTFFANKINHIITARFLPSFFFLHMRIPSSSFDPHSPQPLEPLPAQLLLRQDVEAEEGLPVEGQLRLEGPGSRHKKHVINGGKGNGDHVRP